MITTILGYVAAVMIGLTLGLVGSGGSILTVPVFVYLFGVPATRATTYSLFVVGLAALGGGLAYLRQRAVEWVSAAAFGLPSMAGMALARGIVVPNLPARLLRLGNWELSRDQGLLILFAILMVLASVSMLRSPSSKVPVGGKRRRWQLAFMGFFTGTVMGLVGAGGGFLIVPVLVLRAGLEMKSAVATSLLIIATNSGVGFASALYGQSIDWPLVLTTSAAALAGIVVGTRLSKRISASALRPIFAVFVSTIGIFILSREILR